MRHLPAVLLVLLAGCATPTPAPSWDAFVANAPGQPHVDREGKYFAASTRTVPALAEGRNASDYQDSFSYWCNRRGGGKSGGMNPVALKFHGGVIAWNNNASMTSGLRSRRMFGTCYDSKMNTFIGAMLIDISEGFKGDSRSKPLHAPVLALYDSEAQLEAFANHYEGLERARSQRGQRASAERNAIQREQTLKLRSAARVGSMTSIGVIVEVRHPLVLVQYNEDYRRLFNLPQSEWKNLGDLEAPR